MGVHRLEVRMSLKFTEKEKEVMQPTFMFGDAEEQLSYATDQFGSERVTALILRARNTDIARLALREVDGFSVTDQKRIHDMLTSDRGEIVEIRDPAELKRHGWNEPLPSYVKATRGLWESWLEQATRAT